jgi:alcohol dehydrogenase
MHWMHTFPVPLLAGRGCFEQIGGHLRLGTWLLITTRGAVRRGWADRLQAQLSGGRRLMVCDEVMPNPELEHLDALTQRYRELPLSGLVAIGGGSVLDAAKTLSVTLPSTLPTPLSACFRAGRPQHWPQPLPVVAVPTTSGTGAEVTPFATVWDRAAHKKHSVAGPQLYPTLAVLDPCLTVSLPAQETLYTGLDATSHALESIWNRNSTPITQAFAWHALVLIADAFPKALQNGADLDAREAMQQASVLAGLAIGQTRTAIAHSISYPLTSHYGVPHGLACSFTLPHLIRENMAFFGETHEPIARKILRLLESLLLGQEVRKFTQADLLPLQNEMLSPARSANYVGNIDIERIIRSSV